MESRTHGIAGERGDGVPSAGYGTRRWLDKSFSESEDDPWEIAFRALELSRHTKVLELIKARADGLAAGEGAPRCLDVGCSTGVFPRRLADCGFQVTGMDLSKEAISRATRRNADIEFIVGSVTDSGLEGGSFDVITCQEVIYYVPKDEQEKFVEGLKRLLVPGGLLVLSSRTGSAPYFSEEELVELLGRHFAPRQVLRHGCLPLARWEYTVFGGWKRARKLRLVLEEESEERRRELVRALVATERRRKSFERLAQRAQAHPLMGFLLRSSCRLMMAACALVLKCPVWVTLNELLEGRQKAVPTHTIVALEQLRQHTANK